VNGKKMDKDDKQNTDEAKDSQKDPSKKDIPLWLQGLNDPNDEKSKEQNASDETKTNHWIDDIDQDKSSGDQVTPDKPVENDISDDTLPGWISELSRVEGAEDLSSEDLKTTAIKEENNPWDQPAEIKEKDEETAPEDNKFNEYPEGDGFIEISGIGMPNSKPVEPSISDLRPNENEDLPDWLQEMVSEPVDKDLGDTSPVQIPEDYMDEHELITHRLSEDTPPDEMASQNSEENADAIDETEKDTPAQNSEELSRMQALSDSDELLKNDQNFVIVEEENLQEEYMVSDNSQVGDEAFESSVQDEKEQHDDEDSIIAIDETFMETSEEDTVPIDLSKRTHEVEKNNDAAIRFLPKILLDAKEKLSTNEFDRGLETINIFIEENAFLGDIETWLEELTKGQNATNFAIWEALGDLRIKKGEHQAAKSAYTYATQLLIKMKRD
jgi:hypothetical protein